LAASSAWRRGKGRGRKGWVEAKETKLMRTGSEGEEEGKASFFKSFSPRPYRSGQRSFAVWAQILTSVSHLLLVTNSSINILVYSVFNTQFRASARALFRECGFGGSDGEGQERRAGVTGTLKFVDSEVSVTVVISYKFLPPPREAQMLSQ